MRKQSMFWVALIVAFFFVACSPNGTADKVAIIHEDAEQLSDQIDDLNSRLTELKRETDRFDDADWKELVPEVRTHVLQLQNDGEKLSRDAIRLVDKLDVLHSQLDGIDDYDQ